jgi:hypothetical protein
MLCVQSILHQNPKIPKGQEVMSCSNLVSGLDTGENRTVCLRHQEALRLDRSDYVGRHQSDESD